MKAVTKVVLASLILTALASSTVLGATSGSVNLTAAAPSNTSIAVNTVATSVTNLGSAAVTDVKFGDVTIDSNNGLGFTIGLTSANNGAMVLLNGASYVSAPAATQKIGYTVKVASAGSGTLGTGITASSQLNTALTLSTSATNLSFAGPASAVTSAYKLDLKFSSAASTIMGGNYKDVVTVTIADI